MASIDLEYGEATVKHAGPATPAISRAKAGSNHLGRRFDKPRPWSDN
jgi:hypothetical protein